MQKGIVIKDGVAVKAKACYAGNISTDVMNAEIARLEAKYPTYTVTFYSSDQDATFVSTVVDSPLPVV